MRFPILPHFVAGPPGELKGWAFFFRRAIEDVPARRQHHQVAQTGQSETPIMDQAVDLIDLRDIKRGIEAVIGILFPQGFDEAFLFISGSVFEKGSPTRETSLIRNRSPPPSPGLVRLFFPRGIGNSLRKLV